jgi:HK97 family phage portal protein
VPQPLPQYSADSIVSTFAEQVAADLAGLDERVVNDRGLRGLPAANFVVNRIANAVASMSPLTVLEADGQTPRVPTPLVAHRPMPGLGIFDYWFTLLKHVLMRGNFVGLPIDHDETGWARQVMQINADHVHCYIDTAGYTVYQIGGHVFSADEVIHIRGPHTVPGDPWALTPVEAFRQFLGQALDLQTYGSDAYRSGSVPSAVISLDVAEVSQKVADQVKADWISRFGGAGRRPAVVPRSMNVTPLSWSPHDAEFIESARLSIAQMALVFDTDPADVTATIGGNGTMTYANISARQSARIVETFGPFMRRVEEAWSDLIAGDALCTFDAERTMRMTARELAEVAEIRIRSGVSTIDEERAIVGKPPLDPTPTTTAASDDPADDSEEENP